MTLHLFYIHVVGPWFTCGGRLTGGPWFAYGGRLTVEEQLENDQWHIKNIYIPKQGSIAIHFAMQTLR